MVVIRRAMETSRLRRENAQLSRQEVRGTDMIGNSAGMKLLKSQLEKVTKSNGRVMLTGGPGSGKEVAARWIHANSNRSGAPFVTVSSAAIQPDHMEEVLFGRETPERGVEQGLLEQAHGGIIYFDEVADMPLGTQSKILRVLVDQSFTRVGGTAKVRVDLRVISSTTRDLAEEIAAGRFREELYHRLNVVPIEVPPLEDRREDIPELAQHFIALFNCRTGPALRELGEDAVAMLQTMSWPGNVRQLRNVIERVLILGDGTGPIEAKDLPSQSEGQSDGGRGHVAVGLADDPAAARGAGAVRTALPDGADQPVRRQYQPHGQLRGHGTLRAAPQAEVAGRRDVEQGRRARGAGGGVGLSAPVD
jgi:two-component system nitrogen regulation response regulator NtrX